MIKKKFTEEENLDEEDEEKDVYSEEGREELTDDDEIDELEEGFMEGYEEGEHQAKCAECNMILVGQDFVEEIIGGHHYRFCSSKCATTFENGKKKRK